MLLSSCTVTSKQLFWGKGLQWLMMASQPLPITGRNCVPSPSLWAQTSSRGGWEVGGAKTSACCWSLIFCQRFLQLVQASPTRLSTIASE